MKTYEMVLDEFHYLNPKETIAVMFAEKYNTYALNVCLESFHNETIRLFSLAI